MPNPAKWIGSYAVQIHNTTGVILENITATGANGGIYVNSSVVNLAGTVNVSGNGFGGIEVSKGSSPTDFLLLYVNNVILVNNTEAYGLPTIWEDNVSVASYVSGYVGKLTVNNTVKPNQVQYYIDPLNAEPTPSTYKLSYEAPQQCCRQSDLYGGR